MSSTLEYRLSDLKISFKKQNFNKLDGDRHLSLFSSFMALLSSCFGTGILFMPYVFDNSGVIQAICLVAAVGCLSYQADYSLLKVAKKLGAKNLKDMIYKTFENSLLANLIPLLSLTQLVAASVCYMVIVQHSLSRTMYYLNKQLTSKMPVFLRWLTRRKRLRVLGGGGQSAHAPVHLLPPPQTLLRPHPDLLPGGRHAGGHVRPVRAADPPQSGRRLPNEAEHR